MRPRNSSPVFHPKIIVLLLFLLPHMIISCSNPVKEPFENLIGHWISENGQRQFYFSKDRRLVITDENREILIDLEFNIGVVNEKIGNKIRKKIWLNTSEKIFGKDELWVTFSDDKKHINSTDFGTLIFVDREQKP